MKNEEYILKIGFYTSGFLLHNLINKFMCNEFCLFYIEYQNYKKSEKFKKIEFLKEFDLNGTNQEIKINFICLDDYPSNNIINDIDGIMLDSESFNLKYVELEETKKNFNLENIIREQLLQKFVICNNSKEIPIGYFYEDNENKSINLNSKEVKFFKFNINDKNDINTTFNCYFLKLINLKGLKFYAKNSNKSFQQIEIDKKLENNKINNDNIDIVKEKENTKKDKDYPVIINEKKEENTTKKRAYPVIINEKEEEHIIKKRSYPAIINEKEEENEIKKRIHPAVINEKEKKQFFEKMEKNIKDYITKENNTIRCEKCYQIPISKYDDFTKEIMIYCNQCESEKYNLKNINNNNLQNSFIKYNENSKACHKFICNICKKEIEFKNIKEYYYSNIQKQVICKKCLKNYKKNNNDEILIRFDLIKINMDKNYYENIESLKEKIQKNENLISQEEQNLKKLDIYFKDLIKTINNLYIDYRNIKIKEINYKKQIIKDFSNIIFNEELYKSFSMLNFKDLDIHLNYNISDTPLNKISSFFEIIGKPISIQKNFVEDINISSGNIDNIIDKKYKKNYGYSNICISSICKINNQNFCLVLCGESLQIYNIYNFKFPINILENIFEDNNINYILKYNGNHDFKVNYIILALNNNAIKGIGLNEDFENFKILFEIKNENIYFNQVVPGFNNNEIIYNTTKKISCYNFYNKSETILYNSTNNNNNDYTNFKIKKLSNNFLSILINEKINCDNKDLNKIYYKIINEKNEILNNTILPGSYFIIDCIKGKFILLYFYSNSKDKICEHNFKLFNLNSFQQKLNDRDIIYEKNDSLLINNPPFTFFLYKQYENRYDYIFIDEQYKIFELLFDTNKNYMKCINSFNNFSSLNRLNKSDYLYADIILFNNQIIVIFRFGYYFIFNK